MTLREEPWPRENNAHWDWNERGMKFPLCFSGMNVFNKVCYLSVCRLLKRIFLTQIFKPNNHLALGSVKWVFSVFVCLTVIRELMIMHIKNILKSNQWTQILFLGLLLFK